MKDFTLKPLHIGALATFAILNGCRSPTPLYEFEPSPHALTTSSGIDSSRNARVAADWISSPTVYMLAVLENSGVPGLALLNSEDGGDSFAPPVWASEKGKPIGSAGENSPSFLWTPDWLYSAWTENQDIRFARSRWGAPFQKPDGKLSPPIPVPGIPSSAHRPAVAAGTGGRLFVVWTGTIGEKEVVYMSRGRLTSKSGE